MNHLLIGIAVYSLSTSIIYIVLEYFGISFGLETHQDLYVLVTSARVISVNSVVEIGVGVVGVTDIVEIST